MGNIPDRLLVEVSGNIIKNVKSVVVPNTGGLRGIPAAAAVGTVAGDVSAELEVIAGVTAEQIMAVHGFIETTPIEVLWLDTPHIFDIRITAYHGDENACVRITDHHTNIVFVRRNDEILLDSKCDVAESGLTDRSCLSVEGIVSFADTVDLA